MRRLVDLNRSGVALMEIVSEPDARSAEEAVLAMRKLRSILRYLGTCDGNMEEGSLRCDANVSVRRPGDPLGTRCEIKNLNSMRFVGRAVELEARRQIEVLEAGGTIEQETRLFDAVKGETRAMRTKEEAHDYRYFPDPDLLPLELEDALIARLEAGTARAAGRQEGALRRAVRAFGLRRRGAGRRARDRRLFRAGGGRARRQARGELGDGRPVRRAEPGRASTSRARRSRPSGSASSSA